MLLRNGVRAMSVTEETRHARPSCPAEQLPNMLTSFGSVIYRMTDYSRLLRTKTSEQNAFAEERRSVSR